MNLNILGHVEKVSPKQIFWYVIFIYTVAIAIVTTPGILPVGVAELIFRVQNGVSVAVVAYLARKPFPSNFDIVAQTPAQNAVNSDIHAVVLQSTGETLSGISTKPPAGE